MLFSGSTFFLSTKLSLPDTRVLSEFIRNNGGTLAPNASDAKTITVVDTWEPKGLLADISKGHKSLYAGQAIIRYCISKNVQLPISNLPLLCMALKDQRVSFSGIESEVLETLVKIVEWCGGALEEPISEKTTVLVASGPSRAALEFARPHNIPCVACSWLERVFQTKELVEFELYQIPPLQGSIIVFSGIRTRQAFADLKSLATALGAYVSAELVPTRERDTALQATHLVVEPSAIKMDVKSKYHYAKSKGLPVVSKDWLIECQKAKRWLPETNFIISTEHDPVPRHPILQPSYNLNVETSVLAAILRECHIYICCMDPAEAIRLTSLVTNAHGHVTSAPSNATHIIIWLEDGTALLPKQTTAQIEKIGGTTKPLIVSSDWLETSIKSHQLVDTTPFRVNIDFKTRWVKKEEPIVENNVPSDIATHSANSSSSNIKKRARVEVENLLEGIDWEKESEDMQAPGPKKFAPVLASNAQEPQSVPSNSHKGSESHHLESMVQTKDTEPQDDGHFVFSGCSFLSILSDTKLRDYIIQRGGLFYVNPHELPLDVPIERLYILAPHGVYLTHKNSNFEGMLNDLKAYAPIVVTAQWLEHCAQMGQLMPTASFLLFTPLPFPREHYCSTMRHLSICVASIAEPENSLLSALAVWLGCKNVTTAFLPKSTTHVISLNFEGKKQQAAIKRDLPLVTPEWLYCCAKVGFKVDEQAFKVRPSSHFHNSEAIRPVMTQAMANTQATNSNSLAQRQAHQANDRGPQTYHGEMMEFSEEHLRLQRREQAHETTFVEKVQILPPTTQSRFKSIGYPSNAHHDSYGPPKYDHGMAYNESERQHDQFYSEQARDWSHVEDYGKMVEYSQNGTATYQQVPPIVLFEDLLVGVVLYFSRLSRPESDALYDMARSMGASTVWAYEQSVTHVVTNGKPDLPVPKPPVKGYAREKVPNPLTDHKPYFVSPQWIRQCHLERQKVPEALYPSSLDPRGSLGISMDPSHAKSSGIAFNGGQNAASQFTDPWDAKQTGGLKITHEAGSIASSQAAASKMGHSVSSTNFNGVQTKKGMTSVVVPKTRVQNDFDEFDSLDARYSAHKMSEPHPPPNSELTALQVPVERHHVEAMPDTFAAPVQQAPLREMGPPAVVHTHQAAFMESHHPVVEKEATQMEIDSAPVVVAPLEVPASQSSNYRRVVEIPVVEANEVVEATEIETMDKIPSPDCRSQHEAADAAPDSHVATTLDEERREPITQAMSVDPPIPELMAQPSSLVVDSQDVVYSSQSQVVDYKIVEETNAQTEMMRKLLASLPAQRPLTRPSLGNSSIFGNNPFASTEESRGLNGQEANIPAIPRHIARSALLGMVGGIDSSHSSGSDISRQSTATGDENDVGPTSSPPTTDYLQNDEMDSSRVQRVLYTSLEPSDAVKSKMLGKAQNHTDSASFQESSAAEIQQLKMIMTTSSHQDQSLEQPHYNGTIDDMIDSHLRQNSSASIKSHRSSTTVSSSPSAVSHIPRVAEPKHAMEGEMPQLPENSRFHASKKDAKPMIGPPKSLFTIDDDDDILEQLYAPKRDEIPQSTGVSSSSHASANLFGKPKRKSLSSATAGTPVTAPDTNAVSPRRKMGSSSVSVKHEAAASAVAASSSATSPSKGIPWPTRTDIKVYLSGFDSSSSDEKKQLEEKLKFMGVALTNKENEWTHLVTKAVKVTDRTIVSLARGVWIVSPRWVEDSLKAREFKAEGVYEHRSAKQCSTSTFEFDPRACRLAVAKAGKGLFENMKILYNTNKTLWKAVLTNAGAHVDIYKEDPMHPMTLSTAMKYDFVFTSTEEWDKLSPATQTMLNKSNVVITEFFGEYLKRAAEPTPSEYHPNRRKG